MISILYVDDEEILRVVTQQYLNSRGFPIETAASGAEALEKLATGGYDVVVSDYEMPKMNGIALLKEVRIRYPDLPFILFTGRGREEVVIEAFDCGADYYLQKGGKAIPQFTELIHKITLAVEKRRADQLIQLNQKRLHKAHEIGKTGCWEYNLKTGYIWGSEEGFQIFGYHQPAGEMEIEKIECCILEREQVHQALLDLIEKDTVYDIVYTINPADGLDQKIIQSVASLERDSLGKPERITGIIQDITSRRRIEQDLQRKHEELSAAYEEITDTEEELRHKYDELLESQRHLEESEERFTLAMQGANDGLWDWNLVTDSVYYSPRWISMLGYGENEIEPHVSAWRRLIHPDDLERAQEEVNAYLDGSLDQYRIEFRMIHKDGSLVHILARAFVHRDPSDGKPLRLVGTHVDITERKHGEQALLESENQLQLKLESILSPDYDIGEEEFANIIDRQEIELLMNDFYNLVPIGVAILDLKGNILVAKGWQDICINFHRKHEESCRNCIESDRYLTRNVKPGQYLKYRCKNNMWDVVTPIVIGGKHMGNLFIGQFFFDDEIPDVAIFADQAEKYGFEKEAYLAALNQVPRWSREKIDIIMDFYTKFTSIISRLSYSNLKLAKTLLDYRQVVEALSLSEEKFREYIEYSPEGIFVFEQDGRFIEINKAACSLLGYSREELLHLTTKDLIPRDLMPNAIQSFQKLLDREKLSTEFKLLRKDGIAVAVSLNAVQLPDGTFMAFCIDITERNQAEQALRESQEHLAEAQRLGQFGSWTFISASEKIHWTDEVFRIYGRNPSDGEPDLSTLAAWYHPEARDDFTTTIQDAMEKGISYEREWRIIRPDGSLRYVQVRGKSLVENGLVVGLWGTIQDITTQKMTEKAIHQANRQLSLLTGITRHDINNNLTVILGSLSIAEEAYTDPDLQKILLMIKAASSKIQTQIEFTKVYQDLGTYLPQWQYVDAILPYSYIPDTISLQADVTGVEIYADPMFEKVFFNLLDNSIRHGQDVTEIRVSCSHSNQEMTILWQDNGIGVVDDEKEQIFDRGFGRNTGLGLFLVREILSLTGISIRESGVPGKGARFEIQVPKEGYRISGPADQDRKNNQR